LLKFAAICVHFKNNPFNGQEPFWITWHPQGVGVNCNPGQMIGYLQGQGWSGLNMSATYSIFSALRINILFLSFTEKWTNTGGINHTVTTPAMLFIMIARDLCYFWIQFEYEAVGPPMFFIITGWGGRLTIDFTPWGHQGNKVFYIVGCWIIRAGIFKIPKPFKGYLGKLGDFLGDLLRIEICIYGGTMHNAQAVCDNFFMTLEVSIGMFLALGPFYFIPRFQGIISKFYTMGAWLNGNADANELVESTDYTAAGIFGVQPCHFNVAVTYTASDVLCMISYVPADEFEFKLRAFFVLHLWLTEIYLSFDLFSHRWYAEPEYAQDGTNTPYKDDHTDFDMFFNEGYDCDAILGSCVDKNGVGPVRDDGRAYQAWTGCNLTGEYQGHGCEGSVSNGCANGFYSDRTLRIQDSYCVIHANKCVVLTNRGGSASNPWGWEVFVTTNWDMTDQSWWEDKRSPNGNDDEDFKREQLAELGADQTWDEMDYIVFYNGFDDGGNSWRQRIRDLYFGMTLRLDAEDKMWASCCRVGITNSSGDTEYILRDEPGVGINDFQCLELDESAAFETCVVPGYEGIPPSQNALTASQEAFITSLMDVNSDGAIRLNEQWAYDYCLDAHTSAAAAALEGEFDAVGNSECVLTSNDDNPSTHDSADTVSVSWDSRAPNASRGGHEIHTSWQWSCDDTRPADDSSYPTQRAYPSGSNGMTAAELYTVGTAKTQLDANTSNAHAGNAAMLGFFAIAFKIDINPSGTNWAKLEANMHPIVGAAHAGVQSKTWMSTVGLISSTNPGCPPVDRMQGSGYYMNSRTYPAYRYVPGDNMKDYTLSPPVHRLADSKWNGIQYDSATGLYNNPFGDDLMNVFSNVEYCQRFMWIMYHGEGIDFVHRLKVLTSWSDAEDLVDDVETEVVAEEVAAFGSFATDLTGSAPASLVTCITNRAAHYTMIWVPPPPPAVTVHIHTHWGYKIKELSTGDFEYQYITVNSRGWPSLNTVQRPNLKQAKDWLAANRITMYRAGANTIGNINYPGITYAICETVKFLGIRIPPFGRRWRIYSSQGNSISNVTGRLLLSIQAGRNYLNNNWSKTGTRRQSNSGEMINGYPLSFSSTYRSYKFLYSYVHSLMDSSGTITTYDGMTNFTFGGRVPQVSTDGKPIVYRFFSANTIVTEDEHFVRSWMCGWKSNGSNYISRNSCLRMTTGHHMMKHADKLSMVIQISPHSMHHCRMNALSPPSNFLWNNRYPVINRYPFIGGATHTNNKKWPSMIESMHSCSRNSSHTHMIFTKQGWEQQYNGVYEHRAKYCITVRFTYMFRSLVCENYINNALGTIDLYKGGGVLMYTMSTWNRVGYSYDDPKPSRPLSEPSSPFPPPPAPCTTCWDPRGNCLPASQCSSGGGGGCKHCSKPPGKDDRPPPPGKDWFEGFRGMTAFKPHAGHGHKDERMNMRF